MFIVNGFGNWMARYIEKTVPMFILYNLTSYAHGRPMEGAILNFFDLMDTRCKMQAISIKLQPRNA